MSSEIDQTPVTKSYLEIVLGRLENKIDSRFNALEAKINSLDGKINGVDGRINSQRIFLIVVILGIVVQIISIWAKNPK
jgi:hypothetical protein